MHGGAAALLIVPTGAFCGPRRPRPREGAAPASDAPLHLSTPIR